MRAAHFVMDERRRTTIDAAEMPFGVLPENLLPIVFENSNVHHHVVANSYNQSINQ